MFFNYFLIITSQRGGIFKWISPFSKLQFKRNGAQSLDSTRLMRSFCEMNAVKRGEELGKKYATTVRMVNPFNSVSQLSPLKKFFSSLSDHSKFHPLQHTQLASLIFHDLKSNIESFIFLPSLSSVLGSIHERRASLLNRTITILPKISSIESSLELVVELPLQFDRTYSNVTYSHIKDSIMKDFVRASQTNWTLTMVKDSHIQLRGLYSLLNFEPPLTNHIIQLAIEDAACVFSHSTAIPLEVSLKETLSVTDVNSKAYPKLECGIPKANEEREGGILNSRVRPSILMNRLVQKRLADRNQCDDLINILKNYEEAHTVYISPLKSLIPPHRSLFSFLTFPVSFILNYRFYLIFMARTLFQALRPLLAFCIFGDVMKIALAAINSGVVLFFFSFILAFEVLYFFLQCYISYVFLGMFFATTL